MLILQLTWYANHTRRLLATLWNQAMKDHQQRCGITCVTLACVILSAMSVRAQSRPDQTIAALERDFQAAMTAEDQGDLQRAEALLVRLRSGHRDNFAINESLGLLYLRGERFNEALPLLEAAVREQPSSDVAHANLGATYFKLNRSQEALKEFDRAAQINPGNVATQTSLGQLWMDAQQPERAAEAFAAALEQQPGDPDLLLQRAQALVESGRTADAADVLRGLPTEEQLQPTQAGAEEIVLGNIEERKGVFQQAGQHYARAVKLDPSEANVWALDSELLRHWTFDAAIRELEPATVKFPQSMRLKLALGAAYFGDSRYYQAILVFADLLDTDKNNPLYAQLLGVACSVQIYEPKTRCDSLVSYAEAHPADARPSTYAAEWLLESSRTDEQILLARTLLSAAMTADPKLAEAQFQMGRLKQRQNDWQGSISYLQKAVALKPDYSEAHYRLGLAYWRVGRKDDSREEMQLRKKYSDQEQADLNDRLRNITTLLVKIRN